jgi:hypothetical protein
MRLVLIAAALPAVLSSSLAAQAARPARPIPPAAGQIAAAVLPLPEAMRAGARVWGYAPDGGFVELRAGTGSMTCIADDPKDDRFHVACYHNSMEAFMARGRELRAQGRDQNAVDSVRTADVLAGRIRMPPAASLYSLTGTAAQYDAATNTVHGARPLFVIYVPFATSASLGLPETPMRNAPWMMHAGDPNAHVMFVPEMGPSETPAAPAAAARPARP